MRRYARSIALVLLITGGCTARPVDPLAPRPGAPAWPPPPDRARVSYLGALTGSEDFGRRPEGAAFWRQLLHGPEPASKLNTPLAVDVHPARDVVAVADSNGRCVHLFDLVEKRYRRIDECPGEAAGFEVPSAVAWVGEDLWIADAKRGAIAIVPPTGQGRWIGGERLKRPAGMAYGAGERRCYVVDAAAHAVAVFEADGRWAFSFGERGAGSGQFNFPSHIAVGGDGTLAVSDSLNFRVQRFDAAGRPIGQFGRKGDAAGDLALPKGLAHDRAGNIWVADANFENIQGFTAEGSLLMALGREGQGAGEFWLPAGLSIDLKDRLFVADSYNRRVQVFQLLP